MPAINRSRVDLPAPLCPTRPTRSPCSKDTVMSRSASIIGTRDSVPILPPTLPSTSFLSERLFASKIGKSTAASRTSMLTIWRKPHSHPVGNAGTVVAQRQHRQCPAHDRETTDNGPVCPSLLQADQRCLDDLH